MTIVCDFLIGNISEKIWNVKPIMAFSYNFSEGSKSFQFQREHSLTNWNGLTKIQEGFVTLQIGIVEVQDGIVVLHDDFDGVQG